MEQNENHSKLKFNLTDFLSKVKIFFTKATYYSVIGISLVVGFGVGYYYNVISEIKFDKKPQVTNKNEVTIAVDEKSNLLVINKSNGAYVMYEDSIGYVIFNLYARNMFGQHAPNQVPVVTEKK